jgi:hypothetical protein
LVGGDKGMRRLAPLSAFVLGALVVIGGPFMLGNTASAKAGAASVIARANSRSAICRGCATRRTPLASDEAVFAHGTVIDVDGGRAGVDVIAASKDKPRS